jgi:D-3-phosphoglycerate dehydrogenase
MSKLKVVITDYGAPGNEIEEAELRRSGLDVELCRLDARTAEEVISQARDADGLLVGFAPITREVIEGLDRCRVISRYGIGYNNVDVGAATERGIIVCNVPDYCIEEVSTHTIGFLLCLNRHIHFQDGHIRAGQWVVPDETAPARLPGQVLGIVGLGNIGQMVGRKAQALKLQVQAFDPFVSEKTAGFLGIKLVSLDELLWTSDYVSLHCPLTDETRHLIGAAELESMKPSAYLINMARGPVVDQAALTKALQDGIIAGAGLDVFEEEPLPVDDPLVELDNVIMTRHSSSWSEASSAQLRQSTARNVVMVLQGKIPPSIVNRQVLESVTSEG